MLQNINSSGQVIIPLFSEKSFSPSFFFRVASGAVGSITAKPAVFVESRLLLTKFISSCWWCQWNVPTWEHWSCSCQMIIPLLSLMQHLDVELGMRNGYWLLSASTVHIFKSHYSMDGIPWQKHSMSSESRSHCECCMPNKPTFLLLLLKPPGCFQSE